MTIDVPKNVLSHEDHDHSVLMPESTAAPLVLALGIAVAATAVVFGWVFLIVGGGLFVAGLMMWIASLLPGKGHIHEPLVAEEIRPSFVHVRPGTVETLYPGMPGFRFRLPEKVHPISAGVKGGLVGGLLMPIPALLYGLLSGNGIWYPINLLPGMVIPGMDQLSIQQLQSFRLDLFLSSCVIHIVISTIVGLIYGVLMPTLPSIPKSYVWAGLLMPILWTGIMYLTLGVFHPLLSFGVDWSWFIFSQFLFGIVAAIVVESGKPHVTWVTGMLGGIVGGLAMPFPALVWALSTGRTIWYPANLLAAMVYPGMRSLPSQELQAYHFSWLLTAIVIHATMSIAFGILFGASLQRLPKLSTALPWGGMVLPMIWSGMSYGLMGIVNPLMQARVDWPWFIVSQFVFGIVAAIVVQRSEMVAVAPSGPRVDFDRNPAK